MGDISFSQYHIPNNICKQIEFEQVKYSHGNDEKGRFTHEQRLSNSQNSLNDCYDVGQ